jgi:IMP dehydrogenase
VKVLELMKVHVVRISPESTVREAVDMFDLYQVPVLPVVDTEGRILGIASESILNGSVLQKPVDWQAVGATSVSDVMAVPAVSIDENADASDALDLMREHDLERIPVIGDGRLVGMLSRNDISQALLDGRLTT